VRVARLTAPAADTLPAAVTKPLIPPAYTWLILILALFLTLALAYARATPAWQAPDEPAHFNYVQFLADHAQLPVLQQGDYPAGEVPIGPDKRLTDVSAFRYEAHQPPLFYALAALVYKVHPTLTALRTLSILFGAALLPVAFWCVRVLAPNRSRLWLGVAAFLAFIPMHLFDAGTVENDTLADLVLSLLLLAALARWPWPAWGLLLGLAVLTKLTIYLPALLLFSFWLWDRPGMRTRVLDALRAVCVALVISGWWLVRNGLIYSWSDILVQSRQAQVAASQVQTSAGPAALEHFAVTGFESFWGQFGWMSIPLPNVDYLVLLALTALAVAGWTLRTVGKRAHESAARCHSEGGSTTEESAPSRLPRASLAMHIVWVAVLAEMVIYNLKFVQPQGRYLFPALVPIGLFYVGGFAGVFPRGKQAAAVFGLSVAMLAFSTYVLRHDLIPAFR
jgi:hypothetical protein